MSSGAKKIGHHRHIAQLLEGMVASLPRWYVQEVERQQEARSCNAGLSELSWAAPT